MSRYTVTAHDPRSRVIVGWDSALATCFGEVYNTHERDADGAWRCVVWADVVTVEALQGHLLPFATLLEQVVAHVRHDQRRTVRCRQRREDYEEETAGDQEAETDEHAALDAGDAADLVGEEEEDPEDVQYRAQLDAEYYASLVQRLAQGEDRQTLLEDVGVAAFQRLAAAAQRTRPPVQGVLAHRWSQRVVAVTVQHSAAGSSLGTVDADGLPLSRESVEYWPTAVQAEAALTSGAWQQRQAP